jgi:hypothetical protein
MTTLSQPLIVASSTNGRMSPLENSDRLTRPEFERGYATTPNVKKAELTEGIVYRRNRTIDWFVLRGGRYEPLAAATDGLCRSEVLPGLWLDAAALLPGDLLTVFQMMQRGLGSLEHATFVRRLQEVAGQERS